MTTNEVTLLLAHGQKNKSHKFDSVLENVLVCAQFSSTLAK